MPGTDVNPGHHGLLDALLCSLPGVVPGRMFGYPAYYVGGKLFACVYGEGVGLKVPEAVAARLLAQAHVAPFQPLGRPRMKQWVHISRTTPEDYRMDVDVFRISVSFVNRRTKQKAT